nr:acyl-CoA dehydrogenase family protein [Mycoplana dimorpha]
MFGNDRTGSGACCPSSWRRRLHEEYSVEHLYPDVRLFRLYEGTSQIQQIIIGREMTRN